MHLYIRTRTCPVRPVFVKWRKYSKLSQICYFCSSNISPILHFFKEFFWLKYFFHKSLKLYYASIYQNQNLASSPSFCKKEKIFKIVSNLLILFCQYISHFELFQRIFLMKILHLFYIFIISIPEV